MNSFPLDDEYILSPEQKKFFDENGFLFVPGLLKPDELDYYREVIDNAVYKRTSHDTRPLSEKTPYEREFLQCGHLWQDFPAVKKLTMSKRPASVASQLLNADHVRLWHDQALYKLPGGDATEPHQDVSYWPMKERNAGTIWIALEEVTEEMGAMHFIPRSHKSGIDGYNYRIEDSINKTSNILEDAAKAAGTTPVAYNLKPGDATFHHGLTVHFTKPNFTDKTRKGMTIIYFADGVRYDADSPAHEHFCAAGSHNNEPIATDRTPIII